MTAMNLVPLRGRNEEIVRAVAFAQGEVGANLECGLLLSKAGTQVAECLIGLLKAVVAGQGNPEISKGVDEFVASLNALEQGAYSRILSAEARATEMSEKFDELLNRRIAPATPLDIINKELRRRRTHLRKVRAVLEEYEVRRDALLEQVEQLQAVLKFELSEDRDEDKARRKRLQEELDSLTATIDGIAEGIKSNNEEMGQLNHYKEAVRLVAEGLTPGIIGKNFDLSV